MDAIMNLLGNFDPAALLPNISLVVGLITFFSRLAILAIPALLATFGYFYYFKPVKEINRKSGYRTYFGMGSKEAWDFVQHLAGLVYLILGGVMGLAMLVVSIILFFKSTLDMLTIATVCLIIEAILTCLAVLTINILMAVRYDRDGRRRK